MPNLLLTAFLAHPDPEGLLAATCAALLAPADVAALSAGEQALIDAAPPVTPAASAAAAATAGIRAGGDPLGELFCAIRSPAARRDRGQFYTPATIVAAMTTWALSNRPVRVVDAGCGSGRYTVALRRAGFTGQIVAVDLDPLAALMTRATLAAAGLGAADVRCASFLTLDLPAASGVTAWLGNPPYLRHHNLTAEVKAWAKQAGARLGVPVSGLAGLHALFFLAVAEHAAPGDVGTFITSSEWLEARYGALVRALLAGRLGLVRLDVVDPAALTFDDATTTAAVASFHVGTSAPPDMRAVTTPADLATLAGGRTITRNELAACERWSSLLVDAVAVPPGRVALGQHMRVSRGLATGANKFFAVTPARAAELGLSRWALPLVARAEEILGAPTDGVVRTADVKKVLLELPDRGSAPEVEAYVAAAEQEGVHNGYINSSRAVWYQVAHPASAPDALATCMARQATKFALNPDGALNLNTVHGLRAQPGFPPDLVPVLIAWLNAHRAELVGGRTYAGGLRKVEPKEMEGYLVPDEAGLRAWARGRLTEPAST